MSWTVGWTNERAQKRPEQWMENCVEHRMENCLEQNRLEGQKWPEKRLEQGFP
jgi:hypothetical protein